MKGPHSIQMQERWSTPVSDAASLAIVSLVDDGTLRITLQDLRDTDRRRFEVVFERVAAYRNILEEYRTSEPPLPPGVGWTAIVRESSWLAELRSTEPLLDVYLPGCQHFLIVTEDDVLDIISPDPPRIREVAPAAEGEVLPGRSRVLYHPRDRAEIEALIRDVRKDEDV